jgi:hypothetical protein
MAPFEYLSENAGRVCAGRMATVAEELGDEDLAAVYLTSSSSA